MNFVSSHPAFNDTIDSLRNEFKDDKSNNVIICGAHDFSRTQSIDFYKKKFDKVIVFNQEPLTATQRQFMHKGYYTWLKQAVEDNKHRPYYFHDEVGALSNGKTVNGILAIRICDRVIKI